MGNSSSTRKITVVNDETSGVIKISDSVVKRLKGEVEVAKENIDQPAEAQETKERLTAAPARVPPSPSFKKHLFTPYEDVQAQVSHIREQNEQQLQELEAYWREKYDRAEKHASELHEHTKNEYNTVITRVDSMFPKELCQPVCVQHEAQVLQCYQSNPSMSLKCSKEVRDFAECVHQSRMGVVSKG